MPNPKDFLMLLFGAIVTTVASDYSNKDPRYIKIAAFNVQIFGHTKSNNVEIVKMIAQIVQRYDIILIQEIRDKSGKTAGKLLKAVNTNGHSYAMKVSDRLGRTRSKENYAFYYRNDSGITLVNSFHYDDGSEEKREDTFEREPFVVKFSIPNFPISEIGLIGLHVDPDSVIPEMRALTDVFNATRNKFKINSIIAMGDFNAGCNYLSKKQEKLLPLKSNEYFWPIEYGTDTTLAKSNCSYDRFIISGEELIELAKTGEYSIFKFDAEYGLTKKEAMSVSDHYPIELSLPTTKHTTLSSTTSEKSSGMTQVDSMLICSILFGAMLFMALLKILY